MGVPICAVFLLQTSTGLFWWQQALRGIKNSSKHRHTQYLGICSALERTPVHLLIPYMMPFKTYDDAKFARTASSDHRSLYCGPLTQTAVFRHRFRSRCRGTDRETGSKASIWSGLCVVNIHFWCLGEEKSHIPYFKTKPQDKRGYIQRALEDELGTSVPRPGAKGRITFHQLRSPGSK